jgi:hypothetical protein
MQDTLKALCACVVAACLSGLFSADAAAQDAAIQFRVVATDRNPAACQRFDAALSRVHTFTPTANGASLRSAGGVNSEMAQTTPRVYTTNFSLGGTTLNVVADASKSPKTLTVTEPRLGCRWNAVAP